LPIWGAPTPYPDRADMRLRGKRQVSAFGNHATKRDQARADVVAASVGGVDHIALLDECSQMPVDTGLGRVQRIG
jgi:hypothetical protein